MSHTTDLPGCQPCAALKPAWEATAAALAGVVKVGAVNCETQKALCAQYGVASYPTLRLLRGGSGVAFNGERTAEAMAAWALDTLPTSHVSHLSHRRPETLASFLNGPCAAKPACVIVLHSAAEAPAWLKASTFAARSWLPVAEARGAAGAPIAARLGVTSLPAAAVVCGGDPERVAIVPLRASPASAASDAPDRAAFTSLLDKTLGGGAAGAAEKFCASVKPRVRPKLGGDYAKMKVGELRALLASRGESCALCAEKGDFVAELQRMEREEAEAAAAAAGGGRAEL